jgi:chaperone required for assembly of F1-ATPase
MKLEIRKLNYTANVTLHPHRQLSFDQVKVASRLEEEFQVEVWGVVEGGELKRDSV